MPECSQRPSAGGLFAFLLVVLLSLSGCGSEKGPQPLRVFCAASLSAAVNETARREGISLALNSAGSNLLVRQVEQGAVADLLLLADDHEARRALEPRGYQIVPLASNRLVVIAPFGSKPTGAPFEQTLSGARELAVADAATAPLGAYTEEALRGLPLPTRLIPLKDAEAVLSSVALSHAGLGIVYRSDALTEPDVRVLAEIPADRHRDILYVAALPPDAHADGQRLTESLLGGAGRSILKERGFLPLRLATP